MLFIVLSNSIKIANLHIYSHIVKIIGPSFTTTLILCNFALSFQFLTNPYTQIL